MTLSRRVTLTLAVTLLAALVTLTMPAYANEVLAGYDLWSTPPGGGVEDFGGGNTPSTNDDSPPIPQDFFGPGSDPFIGRVDFVGVPLGTFLGQPTGDADTIVQRLNDTTFSGQTDTVSIELVALSLTSVDPIQVTYGGSNPELWDVSVELSPTNPSTGQMVITHDQADPGGGTYDAAITVCPVLIFTPQGGGAAQQLNPCAQIGAVGQVVQVFGQPWVHNAAQPQQSPLSGPNFFVVGQTVHDGPHPAADPVETPNVPAVPGASTWMLALLSALLLAGIGFSLRRRMATA